MQNPSTATLSTPRSRRYIAAARMSPSAPSQSSEPIRCSASAASTPTFPCSCRNPLRPPPVLHSISGARGADELRVRSAGLTSVAIPAAFAVVAAACCGRAYYNMFLGKGKID